MGNLKANLRTIGSRCRLVVTEVLSYLVRFVAKMAHKDMDARRIMDLLTEPLERSKLLALESLAKLLFYPQFISSPLSSIDRSISIPL